MQQGKIVVDSIICSKSPQWFDGKSRIQHFIETGNNYRNDNAIWWKIVGLSSLTQFTIPAKLIRCVADAMGGESANHGSSDGVIDIIVLHSPSV
jgi:hypothetical protein